MKIKEILNKIEKELNIENNLNGYKINKKIFRLTFGLLLIFFALCLIIDNPQQMNYVNMECKSDNYCINDLYLCNPTIQDSQYLNYEICQELDPIMYEKEFLQPHEKLGDFPPFYLKYKYLIFSTFILIAFIVNHLKENTKRYKKW